ncbi:unnamed protein product [Vitrella brassicaformis CCMP3155]|uniref:Uncharacterized protein n=2 Tax=Vitrella brassicaformis TaxID=1169539 RepID=A0A0G4FQ22_VITBC|nr:unnamed protein product [Vitrella brassicaformis CCMP3155]|mmetsp:Transcript_31729/g.78634  ORF Transcript_31729/g.78634 Transcript_31729/m.78634 type:complete len:202 (+) Transcript_31729:86-691(+)|eukprot:CEM15928.1 unnamed protein product [Vitrella brassicaformis CCMP3155]
MSDPQEAPIANTAVGKVNGEEHQQETLMKLMDRQRASRAPCIRMMMDGQKCVVNGFHFSFIHLLEGKWSGQCVRLAYSGQQEEQKAASTKIQWNEEGFWSMRETTAGEDGAAYIRHYRFLPVGHGLLSVDLEDGPRDTSLTLTESAVSVGATLIGTSPKTGLLEVSELITLTSEGMLQRTSQRFNNGRFESLWVFSERRVE